LAIKSTTGQELRREKSAESERKVCQGRSKDEVSKTVVPSCYSSAIVLCLAMLNKAGPLKISEEDFYQQTGYWERANDGLARWLGVQHLAAIDVVILVPLIPLFGVFIIWWAPWEPWVWKNVPKVIIGPYLLYCAFAFWYFHAASWIVLIVAVIGAVVCAIAINGRQARSSSPDK
jgi:hypothetical protein